MKNALIVLTGPTAVGKTSLSIELAKALKGSIISADSVQVYKYMDIGSAKIQKDEMQGVPHYLIDVLDPMETFDVSRFQMLAKKAIEDIYAQGRIPIIVGGTGFYIQSIIYDIDFTETTADHTYRKKLEKFAKEKGALFLHEELKKVDPKAAQEIHPNNIRRVIRALEFFEQTHTCISCHNEKERQKKSPYNVKYFVLNDKRQKLYEQINERVDTMIANGLLQEVNHLKEKGYCRTLSSMQALGYKEVFSYIENELSLEDAIYTLKRDTRHFAKRQLTWFKRERNVIWINKDEYNYNESAMLVDMLDMIKKGYTQNE